MLLDDRYLLGPQIGRGGMATVHAATDTKLQRPVAVKLFHPGGDEVTLARLQAEARLLAGLSHPGLLRVFDLCLTDERPYLVLQLITGTTLRAMINKRRLEPKLVARLGTRLADTLRYVHTRHIMHRDIKPSNVLLDNAGECYLADFGIARAAGSARLTRSGQCVGTAAYLAPEQVAGDQTGPAADIYSLGLVLLECLTGRPEYTGTEVEAALARLTRSPHVPHRLPPVLRRTLIAMTARDPGGRPDAATCAQRFDEALTGLSTTAARAMSPLTELSALPPAPAKPPHPLVPPVSDLPAASAKPSPPAVPPVSDLPAAPQSSARPTLPPVADLSTALEDQTKPWDRPLTDLPPARPAHRRPWLLVSARAAVALALVAGIGLATLLPGQTAGSTPPGQPAAPPAQSGGTPPAAVDVAPQTAVDHLVAPAAQTERQPPPDETKKNQKKGRQDGEKGGRGKGGKGDDG